MIERVRITIITHEGKFLTSETTPLQIEHTGGELLNLMYSELEKAEQKRQNEGSEGVK